MASALRILAVPLSEDGMMRLFALMDQEDDSNPSLASTISQIVHFALIVWCS